MLKQGISLLNLLKNLKKRDRFVQAMVTYNSRSLCRLSSLGWLKSRSEQEETVQKTFDFFDKKRRLIGIKNVMKRDNDRRRDSFFLFDLFGFLQCYSYPTSQPVLRMGNTA